MKSTLAVDAAQVCSRPNRARYAERQGLNPRGAEPGAEAAIRNLQACRARIWHGGLDDHARCSVCRVAMRERNQWVTCISTAPGKTLRRPTSTVSASCVHRGTQAISVN